MSSVGKEKGDRALDLAPAPSKFPPAPRNLRISAVLDRSAGVACVVGVVLELPRTGGDASVTNGEDTAATSLIIHHPAKHTRRRLPGPVHSWVIDNKKHIR